MFQTCIITDNTVQFTHNKYYGQDFVKILPLIPINYGVIPKKSKGNQTTSETTNNPPIDLYTRSLNFIQPIQSI
ncbi:MAG: hypothetical protein ACPL7A_02665, partial [Anaerolineales bacterium]